MKKIFPIIRFIIFAYLIGMAFSNSAFGDYPYQFKTDDQGREYIEHGGVHYLTEAWRNRIVVTFKDGVAQTSKENKFKSFAESWRPGDKKKKVWVVRLRHGQNMDDVIKKLKRDPQIESVSPDGPAFFATGTTPKATPSATPKKK